LEDNDEEANLIGLFSSYRKRKANKHLQQSLELDEAETNNVTMIQDANNKTLEAGSNKKVNSPKRLSKKAKLDDAHLKSSSTRINMSTPFNNKTQQFVNSLETPDFCEPFESNEQTINEPNEQMNESEALNSQTIHLQLENSELSNSVTKNNSPKKDENKRPMRLTRKKLLEDSRNNLLNSDASTEEDSFSDDLDFGEVLRDKPSKKKEMEKKNRLAKSLRKMNLTKASLIDSSDEDEEKSESNKKKTKKHDDSAEYDGNTPRTSKSCKSPVRNTKSTEAEIRKSPRNNANNSSISIQKANKTKSSAQYEKDNDFEVESIEKSSSDDDDNSRISSAFKKKIKHNSPKRKGKRPWNETETLWLIVGVELYEKGSWIKILKEFSDKFENRSSVDLKDKYRNLTTNSQKLANYQKQARIILKNMQS